ncbi:MAG TPA: winged helix-turn-helix domain-containing protein [Thermoproteota archaeon]|nr:winged helix-turn-helix domain-containing protein [Thermoproteota archaeon]
MSKLARKYRSSISIVADILNSIKEEERIGKTRLMQKANLPTDRMQEKLDELISLGLVVEESEDDRKYFRLTEKAYDFLREYERTTQFLSAFGIYL